MAKSIEVSQGTLTLTLQKLIIQNNKYESNICVHNVVQSN